MVSRLLHAVPNILSLARLTLGVSFPWIAADWRAGAVVAAALSDLADGAVSRWFHASGTTGRILDPVADKVFVLAVVATLLVEGRLGLWEVALVGLRDWAVLFGGCWLLARGRWSAFRRMPPTLLGKATTAAQFLFLLTLLTAERWAGVVFIPTAILSGASAVDYLMLRRPSEGGAWTEAREKTFVADAPEQGPLGARIAPDHMPDHKPNRRNGS